MDLDNLRNERDELADVIDTVKTCIWNTKRQDLKEDLLNAIVGYENKLEMLEEKIEELEAQEYEQELNERNQEYNKIRI